MEILLGSAVNVKIHHAFSLSAGSHLVTSAQYFNRKCMVTFLHSIELTSQDILNVRQILTKINVFESVLMNILAKFKTS